MIKLSKLKLHPNNPRLINNNAFEKLCQSLKSFPEMMKKREIIIDSWNNPIVLCGNQRFKALKKIGYKEIPEEWIKIADDLTEDQKKELMIKDNIQAGEWDFDLFENWDKENLNDWGVEIFSNDNLEEIIDEFDKSNNPNDYSNKYFTLIIADFKATINDSDLCSKLSSVISNIKKSISDDKNGIEKANTIARHIADYFIKNETSYISIRIEK